VYSKTTKFAYIMLIFYAGESLFAIDNRYVLRIVPKVTLKAIPFAPVYMAGMLNLEGKLVPVIDFCQLIVQRPSESLLSSRIILIQDSAKEHTLGLLGEKVENILPISADKFTKTNFHIAPLPFLDRIYNDGKEIIQYVDIEEFLNFLKKASFFENHG
jgi:chemotaxis-related protein WspB